MTKSHIVSAQESDAYEHILAARGIFRIVLPLEQEDFEQATEALRKAGT